MLQKKLIGIFFEAEVVMKIKLMNRNGIRGNL